MKAPNTYAFCRSGPEGLEVFLQILMSRTQGGQYTTTESHKKAGALGG